MHPFQKNVSDFDKDSIPSSHFFITFKSHFFVHIIFEILYQNNKSTGSLNNSNLEVCNQSLFLSQMAHGDLEAQKQEYT